MNFFEFIDKKGLFMVISNIIVNAVKAEGV